MLLLKAKKTLLATLMAGLMMAACGDDDVPADPDDSGTDGPVFMPPDSGLMLRDSTVDDTGMSTCERPPVPPPPAERLPRCSSETRDCVVACPEDAEGCTDACWAADETPADPDLGTCNDCVIADLISCLDAGGCHQEVAEIQCCGERECPPGSAEDCFDVECQPQLQSLFTCGLAETPTCFEDLAGEGDCYDAAPSADAGMDDAGMDDAGMDDAGMDDAGMDDAAMDAPMDAPDGGAV